MDILEIIKLIVPGAVCGLIAWGGMRKDLDYLRRDVDAAHRRLDKINAPAAGAGQGFGA